MIFGCPRSRARSRSTRGCTARRRSTCFAQRGIALVAYKPLLRGAGIEEDPKVAELAGTLVVTPAQLLLLTASESAVAETFEAHFAKRAVVDPAGPTLAVYGPSPASAA